ncbi:hypothetical protein [Pseudoduganella armeniaca]|uniref:hypothetical protein n=1 Tax=Pseudoduganella armeniaca TaxID=2072590 RepID=UPI0011B250D6|nr:hypothetical protein [Pseudoduganella armeniaca]
MADTARLRWAVLLAALAATVAAIFYPAPDDQDPDLSGAVPAQRQGAAATRAPSTPAAPAAVATQHGPDWVASADDPFAARGWQPAPVTAPVARTVEAVQANEPTPPPPPAPLPYQFVGQMVDGGNQIVYLSRGDQVLLARKGETLEGTYKVLDIGATQIEFEMLSSGLRQTLPIPAQDR